MSGESSRGLGPKSSQAGSQGQGSDRVTVQDGVKLPVLELPTEAGSQTWGGVRSGTPLMSLEQISERRTKPAVGIRSERAVARLSIRTSSKDVPRGGGRLG